MHRASMAYFDGLRYAEKWRGTGELYSAHDEEQLAHDTRRDLENEFGPAEYVPREFSRGLYALEGDEGTKGWIG
jgi:hypothetical protein